MVHLERNLLAKLPAKEKNTAAIHIKQIYNAPDKETALKITKMIIDKYQNKYPGFTNLLEESVEGTLTYYGFPEKYRKKIRTTNLIDGVVNKKLKQRSKVINIFPTKKSCLRFICAIMMEIDEEWKTSNRKYIDIKEEASSMKAEDKEFLDQLKILTNKKEVKENEPVHF